MTEDDALWCHSCHIHRVEKLGTECPGCLEDRQREERAP